MLRHYLSLTLRHFARNRLCALISVTGLAIGFCAATLIGLYIHDELTYDHWLPNSDRIYEVSTAANGRITGAGPSDLGLWLRADYPELEAVARLFPGQGFFRDGGGRSFIEPMTWADASVFDVFRFPVVSGTLDGALARPDSIVLTRSVAEKYFGDAEAVGKTLVFDFDGEHPMIVTAVIEDLPSNTNLSVTILLPSHAPFSRSAQLDRTPIQDYERKIWSSASYALLKPNQLLAPLRESVATLVDRHARTSDGRTPSETFRIVMRPIRAIHLSTGSSFEPDAEALGAVYAIAAIGLTILLLACINFVNMLTAVGLRRAVEVGVRKSLGAQRHDLMMQFLSESLLYVAAGAAAGLAGAALALRPLNVFLGRSIDFSMFASWRLDAGLVLLLALVALLAGFYPAAVLSSFRPATVTSGGRTAGGHAGVRQGLVVVQFATLIALLIATAVTYQQMAFGTREALRQASDPIVVVRVANEGLENAMRDIPGVVAATRSAGLPQLGMSNITSIQREGREPLQIRYMPVDYDFFELYGIELAAGRSFSADLGTDASPTDNVWTSPEALVINEAAARGMGFATPEDAAGEIAAFSHPFRAPATFTPQHDAVIVGVVRDFQIGSVRSEIPAAAFYVDPANFGMMSIKLDGRRVPEALDAIDRLWREFGSPIPPLRFFFEESVENIYVDLRRQMQVFSTFTGIAVLLSVLGLVGLAAHAAVSRTKEIGIRKALGGDRWTIVGLLMWQFSKPVLLANLVAWPVAYYAMGSWLQEFARRVELGLWTFVAAAFVTLAVAMVSVLVQAWAMGGMKPVDALRYQ